MRQAVSKTCCEKDKQKVRLAALNKTQTRKVANKTGSYRQASRKTGSTVMQAARCDQKAPGQPLVMHTAAIHPGSEPCSQAAMYSKYKGSQRQKLGEDSQASGPNSQARG